MSFHKISCRPLARIVAHFACVAIFAVTMTGCGDKNKPAVLAKVNDEAITAPEVEFTIERSFDRSYLTTADPDLKQKILDSLIASKAMKQLVKKEMTQEQITKISNQAKAYEEELYVKEYLQNHVTPEPVTAEMVHDYYTKHQEEFGSEAVTDFELLKAPANLADEQRDVLLKKIGDIRSVANWSQSVNGWQKDFKLQYQQGRSKAGLLDKDLEQKIAQLKQGETSDIFYVNGELYLVRVTKIAQTTPKSVAEVSGEIRKKLAPLMLRDAVKKASEEARSKSKVLLLKGDAFVVDGQKRDEERSAVPKSETTKEDK